MKMTRKWRLARTVLIIVGIWFIFQVIGNLWWTGSTYCWGDAAKCVGGL